MSKTGEQLKQAVYGYWANRFGCSIEDFSQPGVKLIEDDGLTGVSDTEANEAGSQNFYIYYIDRRAVLRAAPSVLKQLSLPDKVTNMPIEEFKALLLEKPGVEVEAKGLFAYLDPKSFKPFQIAGAFITRQVQPETENDRLLELYGVCTEEDLDAAEIYIDEPDPVIFGIFDAQKLVAQKLVAYASHRYWGETDRIADIGVLTHPEYRHQGLGKAVVSALCTWCIENNVIPMYRVESEHYRSHNISKALGFQEMATIEALKL